ncbi:MAG: pantetheine-phosphate adenylyltransferase [Clostridia bacterium]
MRCVFSGSFDPITIGHYDVIMRCAKLFDEVYVAVGANYNKNSQPIEIRKKLVEKALKDFDNVTVLECNGLFSNFCINNKIDVIVKGIRNSRDYEYENEMAEFNKSLCNLETIYISATPQYRHISSSSVKELLLYLCNIEKYVPKSILKDIIDIYGKK